MTAPRFAETVASSSFLEWAFLRWVLGPAARDGIESHLVPQQVVEVDGHRYRVDYEFVGALLRVSVELDGFEFHGTRPAFTYDRLRQNDLTATGRQIVRFTYDSIRRDTTRCVRQLQAALRPDPLLAQYVIAEPVIEPPDMDPDPLHALDRPANSGGRDANSYFASIRGSVDLKPLRPCQREAFSALANYFGSGGSIAACVMSVGAGKTALGVAATLGFARRRALVVTPGSVIRGTFARAFDPEAVGNAIYGLTGGPLLPGRQPPNVLVVDSDSGGLTGASPERLAAADVIVTNFHALGEGSSPAHLLAKLDPDDIDLIIVDEAHIAAADSYQRLFRHFASARSLLMSACFQRLDGKPIDADVVYRYRLVDSIADGHAKQLRIHRFAPNTEATVYEINYPDGSTEEITGRDALLAIIEDERRLAHITARSEEPIRRIVGVVRHLLDQRAGLLHPIKPRALFSALGQRHADQIAVIATQMGIPTASIHHSQSASEIARTRHRFESDAGDLQALVHLKMLGQGYDFPPICMVVPMRPYGSFAEFYQFVGRGIRVIDIPGAPTEGPSQQVLDVVHHGELGLDRHIDAIYLENDMEPSAVNHEVEHDLLDDPGSQPGDPANPRSDRFDAVVLSELGTVEARILHDRQRVELARDERERAALAQKYAEYVATSPTPVTFGQYLDVVRRTRA